MQPGDEAADGAVVGYGKHNGIFSIEGGFPFQMFLQQDKPFPPLCSLPYPPQSEPESCRASCSKQDLCTVMTMVI